MGSVYAAVGTSDSGLTVGAVRKRRDHIRTLSLRDNPMGGNVGLDSHAILVPIGPILDVRNLTIPETIEDIPRSRAADPQS